MSVIAVNSWMNQPGGFTEQGGRITSVNVWQVYFNHAAIYEMPHMILAAYMVTGFTIAGVYAAGILRGRRTATTTPGSYGRDCASPTPAHYRAGERPAARACASGLAPSSARAAGLICRSSAYGISHGPGVPSGHAKEPLVNRRRHHPVRGHSRIRPPGLRARRDRARRPLRGQLPPPPSHQPPGLRRDRTARIAAVPLGEPEVPGLCGHREAGTSRLEGNRHRPGAGRAPGGHSGEGQDAPEPELAVRNISWATPGDVARTRLPRWTGNPSA
jgi:Cytochrome bd terminal oxidase subunit I